MAYNPELAQRVTDIMGSRPAFEMKKMFGGVCFLLHGNMACGIIGDELIVRVGPENSAHYLADELTREFDITGRTMKGWVMVVPDGLVTDEEVATWVERGVSFALTLPPKR